jgi:hypothetical protein
MARSAPREFFLRFFQALEKPAVYLSNAWKTGEFIACRVADVTPP